MESGISLIQEILPACSDSERKAADFILAHPEVVVFCTISELSRQSASSAPAIVRLCKRAGVSGYRELQMLLAKDLYSTSGDKPAELPDIQLEAEMSVATVAQEAVRRSKEGLDRLLDILNPEAVQKTVDRIRQSRIVYLFGVGASNLVAQDLAQKLQRLGIACYCWSDSEMQVTAACAMTPQDMAIALSWSGETASMLRAVAEAKKSGAWVSAITRMGSSQLARQADCLLAIPAVESTFRLGATISRIAQLTVVDILFTSLVSWDLKHALPLIERSMRATHPQNKESPREPS